jgi:hypothetical protein
MGPESKFFDFRLDISVNLNIINVIKNLKNPVKEKSRLETVLQGGGVTDCKRLQNTTG